MASAVGKDKEEEDSARAGGGGEQEAEESDGSTESEIPVNLDLAGDSDMLKPLQTELVDGNPPKVDSKLLSKEELELAKIKEEKTPVSGEEMPTVTGYVESKFDMQNTEALESEEEPDPDQLPEGDHNKGSQAESQEKFHPEKDAEAEATLQESENSLELGLAQLDGEGDEEAEVEKAARVTKGKSKKQKKKKKKQRVRKHPPQRDEAHPPEGYRDPEDAEQETAPSIPNNAALKPKRRRAGKWAPSVGMNPVQIRATVELYPSSRPFLGGGIDRPESSADPCENFHCKRGRTCKLNEDKKPFCVCQEPPECPQSANVFDHVCGTDNITYDTSCELFATKCNLEGTKRGHKLQLDYTGPCKFIAQCLNTELVQFPLRMRDWLKNVLLQLYEHDSMSPGFLTPKQRVRVRKIFESERRLRAGDHPIELLVQDFEKNYNMYIYPVHWQFAQMDQHPSDRFLSHSELAPLRVPLVPMEHCTSRFFQECDADKDKQVSFREWAFCFGIKDEDMDVNLLF
ncbi:SPARC-like [Aplochiton taeniatus]